MATVNSFAKFFAAVYPDPSEVDAGVMYGDSNNMLVGTGSAGGANYPGENVVLAGTVYGDSNQFTGNYVVVDDDDVRLNVMYGSNSNQGGLIVVPSDDNVRLGINYDAPAFAKTGRVGIPAESTVKLGTGYDTDNTARNGDVVLPAPANVRASTTYDSPSAQQTGTLVVPDRDDVRSTVPVDATTGRIIIPATGDVRDGVFYDSPTQQKEGTLDPGAGGDIPSADDVRAGVNTGQTVGNLRVPLESQVLQSVAYDSTNPGKEKIGTLDLPGEQDVRDNVFYAGASREGELALPSASDVRLNVPFDAPAVLQLGNVRVPTPENVRAGYQYDSLDSETGTLLVGGGGGTGDGTLIGYQMDVIQGDSYLAANNRAFDFFAPVADWWPSLVGASILFKGHIEKAGTIVQATGAQQVRVEFTSTETAVPTGVWPFDVEATLGSGERITLAEGEQVITDTQTNKPPEDTGPGWLD